jgi:hypothetical protein
MNCPNCGHANEEGAAFCANCGSPLPSSTEPVVPPTEAPLQTMPSPVVTPQPIDMAVPQASSSGMAKAGMWLGIASVAMIVLMVLAVVVGAFALVDQFSPDIFEELQRDPTPENIERLFSQGELERIGAFGMGAVGCCLLSELCALLGLIFGVVGLTQESSRPTRSGRTHSIVGIVFSVLPLLCCVAYFLLILVRNPLSQ